VRLVFWDQVSAAWCRAKRTVAERGITVKSNKQKKAAKRLHKASQKWVAEVAARPIVPDTSDMQKRAQGFADFQALYYAGRQQLGGPRFDRR
jgi:hypothetical protein